MRSLRAKLRASCSFWLEQLLDPDSEAIGQRVEDVQGWVAFASFDGADVGTVQMGAVAKALLGESLLLTELAQPEPDCAPP